ncbi:MAG: ArsR family transcriptional regulator [Thermoplasmatales archaeon]
MAEAFTPEDEKLAGLLIQMGVPRNVSKALVYMKSRQETTSVEIEKNANLRQPEVSIAMRILKEHGWIMKRDIKKEGKGRPVHGYRLAKPFNEIVKELEEEQRKKISDMQNVLGQIQELVF